MSNAEALTNGSMAPLHPPESMLGTTSEVLLFKIRHLFSRLERHTRCATCLNFEYRVREGAHGGGHACDIYLSRTGSAIVCVLVRSKVYIVQDGLQALNIGMSFMRRLKGGNRLARC